MAWLWISGGIGGVALYFLIVMVYLSAKRIEVLQERVDQIDLDLIGIVHGERPYRLLDEAERDAERDKDIEREFGPNPILERLKQTKD